MSDFTEIKSEAEFNETTKSGTVLVDFFAPWCGPCRAQGPILSTVAESVGAKAKIVKVNTDELGGLAQQYDISSIPTLLLFHNGNVANRFVGLQQQSVLEQAINSVAR